jgi:murein DD-endopeptidase MepM/ murein hydrolase activator NlpD
MALVSKKDFCLWVVPPRDGRVRKLRLGLGLLFGLTILLGLLVGTFAFVMGDYARIQLLRGRHYLSLKLAERENSQLLANFRELEARTRELNVAHAKAIAFERSVRQRIDELGSLLQSSVELGVIDAAQLKEASRGLAQTPRYASNHANIISKLEEPLTRPEVPSLPRQLIPESGMQESMLPEAGAGVGGAERDCSDPTAGCDEIKDISFLGSFGARQASSDVAPNVRLDDSVVSTLDAYLSLLKSVPLGVPGMGYVNSHFGYRWSPFGGGVRLHEGVDFSLPNGSQVLSTADGVVREVKRCRTYGLVVDIEHSNRVVTRYAHLSRAFVTEGDKVCRGEIIALAGSSGRSTGPHLHYEVRVDGTPRDPMRFLALSQRLNELL